jgi:hypothetical protein
VWIGEEAEVAVLRGLGGMWQRDAGPVVPRHYTVCVGPTVGACGVPVERGLGGTWRHDAAWVGPAAGACGVRGGTRPGDKWEDVGGKVRPAAVLL